jgi:hypothetical protein
VLNPQLNVNARINLLIQRAKANFVSKDWVGRPRNATWWPR